MEIGSNYQDVKKIGGKIAVFDCVRQISFDSNYCEFRKTEDLRNWDSTDCVTATYL